MRWAIYFAIAYVAILQTAGFFLSIFICMPGGPVVWQCEQKVSVLSIVTSGFNIFIDFYLLFLPLYATSGLQVRTRRKIAVFLVFLVGALLVLQSHFPDCH